MVAPPPLQTVLPQSTFDIVRSGRIAVLPNWLPEADVADLRADAMSLHREGKFSADALAAYGAEKTTKFDASKDRTVLRLGQWKDPGLANFGLRQRFGERMASLRTSLAKGLDRPGLDQGVATTDYGAGSTEISYTRYGPGAFLKRHIDEHHEELKGKNGWAKPTRRSVSWLIYLNSDWDVNEHGGELRCFQRKARCPATEVVGARSNGDLQIGWLRATASDSVERPVFLDSRRHSSAHQKGNCAMYVCGADGASAYVTEDFFASPVLFLAGDFFGQQLLKADPGLASRFHYLEPVKSPVSALVGTRKATINTPPGLDEEALNIAPNGGTLVLFDSVTLPHEVLATRGRERWAASGWFHEDQQPEHHPLSS
jgi:hypothetical protein